MEGAVAAITAADWEPVLEALQAQINHGAVVSVLAVLVSASVGMVFTWWAVRKTGSVLMNAFRKGKISI